MPTLYLRKNDNKKFNNPNVTDHLYVPLNINRNIPREIDLKNKVWKPSPDNKSVDIWEWLSYISKKNSPISNGSYSTHSAAIAAGLTEGQVFYNSTSKQLEVVLGNGAYANDSAASIGGVAVGEHYFNTTSNKYVTRMI